MNFLAHLYLSGDSDELKFGNFIADWVKGKIENHHTYSEKIKQGILLHRKIDDFTDKHFIVKHSSELFKPEFGRYSSIIVDIVYDHFLASLWNNYSFESLNKFAKHCYWVLLSRFLLLPMPVKQFLPHLIASNRLVRYSTIEGLQKSISIMSRVTSLPEKSESAINILVENYDELKNNFVVFFDDIKCFLKN